MNYKLKCDIELLKGSIKKWEGVINGTQLGWPWTTCPLCVQYFTLEQCTGCPVAEKTTYRHCDTTPYREWEDHNYNHKNDAWLNLDSVIKGCKKCKQLSNKEVQFLRMIKKGVENNKIGKYRE